MNKRHWKEGWNRHRPTRLVLSCTRDEAEMVRRLAADEGRSVQDYLMRLVIRAATRQRRSRQV